MANLPRQFPFEVLLGRAPPKALKYPEWVRVRPAVINIAERLCADIPAEQHPGKAQEILSRLTSDERMRRVWDELYKKKRDHHHTPESFYHPACVTHKSLAARCRRSAREIRKKGGPNNEREAKTWDKEAEMYESKPDPYVGLGWSEQDIAVQLFFWHIYREALDGTPVFFSDLKSKQRKLQGIADQLRKCAETSVLLGEPILAEKLIENATDYNDAARIVLAEEFKPGIDDPWIITRRRGREFDPKIRTFIFSLPTEVLFDKPLYGTIAQITNVVFHRTDMTGSKVREMLRLPPGV
jgi:hypothetical protein